MKYVVTVLKLHLTKLRTQLELHKMFDNTEIVDHTQKRVDEVNNTISILEKAGNKQVT